MSIIVAAKQTRDLNYSEQFGRTQPWDPGSFELSEKCLGIDTFRTWIMTIVCANFEHPLNITDDDGGDDYDMDEDEGIRGCQHVFIPSSLSHSPSHSRSYAQEGKPPAGPQ